MSGTPSASDEVQDFTVEPDIEALVAQMERESGEGARGRRGLMRGEGLQVAYEFFRSLFTAHSAPGTARLPLNG